MRSLLAALLFLLALVPPGFELRAAQGHSAWFAREWQTDDGLPDSAVTGIVQTSDGYLWVSTHSGLARFDGEQFTPWPLPIPAERFNPLARALMLGKNDTLWVGIEAGEGLLIGLAKGATNVFRLPNYRPLVMAETPDGTVWAGYSEGWIFSFSNGIVKWYGQREGLSGAGNCWLAVDSRGRLWFSKAGTVGTIEGGQVTNQFSLPEQKIRIARAGDRGIWILAGRRLLKCSDGRTAVVLGELPVDGVGLEPSVLYEDGTGGLWLGIRTGGLFHWNGKEFTPVQTSHGQINSIMEDREGNIWVGTEGGGLNRLRMRVLELHGPNEGVGFETARSVCEDDAGVVWATGLNGALVRQVAGQWLAVTNAPGWPGVRATCVVGDGRGGVWVGTYRGALLNWHGGQFSHLGPEDGLGTGMIRALFLDSRKDLWIGLEAPTRLQRFRNGAFQTLPLPVGSRAIDAITEDQSGTIWLGTLGGYLMRVKDDTVFDHTAHALQPTKPIRALHATPDGGLWIGYAGAGIGWLRNGKFSRFGVEQGLPEDNICGIAQDEGGALWFSGSQGLFRLPQNDFAASEENPGTRLAPIKFGRNDGLMNLHGSSGAWPNAARARDGRLWFTTRAGLVAASPERVQPNRNPPVVLIEKFLVDGLPQEVPGPGAGLRLKPAHRRLEVQSVGLNFAAPEGVLFRYRIKGWDENWSEPGKSRTFTFSRLPAGHYEFQVTACNSAALWSREGARIGFEVEPFLWQRWWFRLVMMAAFAFTIIGIGRYVSFRRLRTRLRRLEQETSVQRDRARIAQDLHDELGSSLTEISFLAGFSESPETDAPELRSRFDNIVERTRRMTRSLDEIVWAVNPVNDTLKATANYLCSSAQEYLRAANVRCRLDVQDDLPSLTLPSEVRHNLLMIVVEAVNNATKHAQASEVWLRIKTDKDQLSVSIDDNGKGFDPSIARQGRNGLTNMRRRCQAVDGSFKLTSEPGIGTAIVVMIPIFRLPVAASEP